MGKNDKGFSLAESLNMGTYTAPDVEVVQADEEKPKKKGFFSRLFEGLTKTRDTFVKEVDEVLEDTRDIDEDLYEELEELMIMADMGMGPSEQILDRVRAEVKEKHLTKASECRSVLVGAIIDQMKVGEADYSFEDQTSVIMVVGVNGVGKTTSIGKFAANYKSQGKRVLIAAADTFRAAAGEQLEEWCHRAGVDMIGGKDGADPSAVIYDACNAAKARKTDILLIDTAGRLHNKKNLMEELRKMNRVIDREFPEAKRETLVVLDGTTGQNALNQAKEFGEVTTLTGIVLTKMDGTAKGGIAVAIQSELQVPVKYIGVGEKIGDLQRFNPVDFGFALFGEQ